MKRSVSYTCKLLGFAFIFVASALFIGFNVIRFTDDFPARSPVNTDTEEKPVIIIDAGHGGEDGGASTDSGIPEKEINLKIATNLADMLTLAGFDVRLTRQDDRMLYDMYSDLTDYTNMKKTYDLRNRLKFVSENNGTLFISLHCNKFPQTEYSGMQVFYSANDTKSRDLADLIKNYNKVYLQPDNDREIKQAYSSIYLLRYMKIPAVLIECGFLSNPNEAALLTSEEYQAKIAVTLFGAITEYLNNLSGS